MAIDTLIATEMNEIGLNEREKIYILKEDRSSSISVYAVDRLCQGLIERGFQIVYGEQSGADEIAISAIVTKAMIRYVKIYQRSFLGKKYIERVADIGFSFRVIRGYNQEVVWVGEVSTTLSDSFNFSDLTYVEQDIVILNKPVLPERRWIKKWVEPVLITCVIAGITYLFYVVRSK